jgi:hypothetical protein
MLASENKDPRNQKLLMSYTIRLPDDRCGWIPDLFCSSNPTRHGLEFVNCDPLPEPSIAPGSLLIRNCAHSPIVRLALGFASAYATGAHPSVVNTEPHELKCQ